MRTRFTIIFLALCLISCEKQDESHSLAGTSFTRTSPNGDRETIEFISSNEYTYSSTATDYPEYHVATGRYALSEDETSITFTGATEIIANYEKSGNGYSYQCHSPIKGIIHTAEKTNRVVLNIETTATLYWVYPSNPSLNSNQATSGWLMNFFKD